MSFVRAKLLFRLLAFFASFPFLYRLNVRTTSNFHFGSSKRKRPENRNMVFHRSYRPSSGMFVFDGVGVTQICGGSRCNNAEVYYLISRMLGNQLMGNYWFCDDIIARIDGCQSHSNRTTGYLLIWTIRCSTTLLHFAQWPPPSVFYQLRNKFCPVSIYSRLSS